MDAIEAILTTRAMRRLSTKDVSEDDLLTCLRAAQQAPSGGNVQPQQYVVVRDPAVRAALGDVYQRAYHRYEATLVDVDDVPEERRDSYRRSRDASRYLAENIGDAPVIVVFLQPLIPWGGSDEQGTLDIGRLDASVYPAVQNFCVAARALGLGTTLTTVIRVLQGEALEVLGAPSDRFEIAALVPVGHPIGKFGQAPRRAVERSIHRDRWGNRG